jgi:DNA-binding transcriptional LysR family regulator
VPLPSWTPDLPTLDLLISVARLGSIGRAAAEHGISQPSASARLSHLERRVGVDLLARSTAGTQLTPAGEAFVAWARPVVEASSALVDGVQALRAGHRARLRVAASLTVAEYLLPEWLLALRSREPDLEVSVTVANSAEVCADVERGLVQLGFVELPAAPAGLSRRKVGSDRLALVVGAGHPLAGRGRRRLGPRDLVEQQLLVREAGSGTRDTFVRALEKAVGEDAAPALAHATALGSTTTIVATARAGGGVGVVSARAVAAELAAGTLVELRVDELDLTRPLHAIWRGASPGDAAAELVAIARS